MSSTQVYPVNVSNSPKRISLFDPFGGENNQGDSNSMLVWWIILHNKSIRE